MTPTPTTLFVPEFETGVTILNARTGQQFPAKADYFATERTAHYIADKYGDGAIYEQDFFPGGGVMLWCSALTRMIKFTPEYKGSGDPPEPQMVNAGMLAAYYRRNPEAEFPGLADKLIRAQLKSGV